MKFKAVCWEFLLAGVLISKMATAGSVTGLYTPANIGSTASNGMILKFDSVTGTNISLSGSNLGASQIQGMTMGPDGNLYASAFNTGSNTDGRIVRFDPNGALIGTFVLPGTGGLVGPAGLTFGPDGNLYVISNHGFNPGKVLRYDGSSGAFIDVFSTGIVIGQEIVFGPDGNLYVTNGLGNSISRFNGATGALLGYVGLGTIGFRAPIGMAFSPTGDLYVASFPTNSIFRFGAATGVLVGRFSLPTLDGYDDELGIPFQYDTLLDLAFGPNQNLYAAMRGYGTAILELNPNTGAMLDQFATLPGPYSFNTGMLFVDQQCAQLGLSVGSASGCYVPSAISEPAPLFLLGLALSGLFLTRRKQLA
ncbi:NHL repeat-containing protein [Accumulibacter sp.]|uniref:Vgb family protein n=1 Tax=Accumulibacter sp. TaxID=2053492 RepID=UPI001A51B3C7|nr:NHL repeat-containing protein [Accumulibacter sp.]MBL8375870.1 NHL repeat-containing protein [Accumulibacter sp.]